MNCDRFLTRVWDKKEKRMIYEGEYFIDNDLIFVGIDSMRNQLIIANCEGILTSWDMGNRFIPMQCYGLQDKTKKLIYEEDFIIVDGMKYWLRYLDSDHTFILNFKDHYDETDYINPLIALSDRLPEQIEILGNYYENPELLEGEPI